MQKLSCIAFSTTSKRHSRARTASFDVHGTLDNPPCWAFAPIVHWNSVYKNRLGMIYVDKLRDSLCGISLIAKLSKCTETTELFVR